MGKFFVSTSTYTSVVSKLLDKNNLFRTNLSTFIYQPRMTTATWRCPPPPPWWWPARRGVRQTRSRRRMIILYFREKFAISERARYKPDRVPDITDSLQLWAEQQVPAAQQWGDLLLLRGRQGGQVPLLLGHLHRDQHLLLLHHHLYHRLPLLHPARLHGRPLHGSDGREEEAEKEINRSSQ